MYILGVMEFNFPIWFTVLFWIIIILWYCINIVGIILPPIVALVYLKNNKLFNNSKINKIIKYLLLFYLIFRIVMIILSFFPIYWQDSIVSNVIIIFFAYFINIAYNLITAFLVYIYIKAKEQSNKRLRLLSLFCLIIRVITIAFSIRMF